MNISDHDKNVFKEIGLMLGIAIVLGSMFFAPDPDAIPTVKAPSMVDFEEHPIIAWNAYDSKGGPCVRIRYEIQRAKTKLYMFNESGKLVHQQPLALSPLKDGRTRTETYVWKLYRTEWSSDIPPGLYTIVVGTEYDKRGIGTEIEIS
tara:strand:+ start:371 stop:814 length:444 start_codon:yes stop_codon:yes gene_type:complete